MSKHFISTTLPYLNIIRDGDKVSICHIGHIFEFVLADVIVRFKRNKHGSENVIFNIGVDEHGQKIEVKALEEGFNNPQDYCDIYARQWKELCNTFHISYNNFYRTTSKEHKEGVLKYYEGIKKYLYEKDYVGKYCVGCEAYITDKEIIDNKCPVHGYELNETSEKNTFFELSGFGGILNVLIDKTRSAELENLIDETITNKIDLSITRKSLNWGVDTGNGDVFYVWAEALVNYVIASGLYNNPNEFLDYWKNSLIICGKDNLKFQAFILQALLVANNIPQTKQVLVHGTVLDANKQKMSKSLGNIVDPIDIVNKYGIDPLRYYLFFGLSTFKDSAFDEKELINVWNSDVVNGLGNLIARTLHLIDFRKVNTSEKYITSYLDGDGLEFALNLTRTEHEVETLFNDFQFQQLRLKLNEIVGNLNARINNERPFDVKNENYHDILIEIYLTLRIVIPYYQYVLTDHSNDIYNGFEEKKKVILFKRIESN